MQASKQAEQAIFQFPGKVFERIKEMERKLWVLLAALGELYLSTNFSRYGKWNIFINLYKNYNFPAEQAHKTMNVFTYNE